MREPEPMRQIHEIRRKMYEETKHLSPKEYVKYLEKEAAKFEKFKKTIKPAKDLEAFFKELNNKRKAG